MVRESVDTSRKSGKEIEDGTWNFTGIAMTKKYGGKNKDVPFYVLAVKYEKGDAEQILLPNMMGPLLRLMGAKETAPNQFDFDTDDFFGFKYQATVTSAADKKDPSKIRKHMGDFKEAEKDEVPF